MQPENIGIITGILAVAIGTMKLSLSLNEWQKGQKARNLLTVSYLFV
jgi:hypothetical protein